MKQAVYPTWDSIKSDLSIIDLLDLIDTSIEIDSLLNDNILDYIELNYSPLYYEEDDEAADEAYDRWRDLQ